MEEKRLRRALRRSLGKNRAAWLYGLIALTSLAVLLMFWCTDVFRDAILSRLELRNGSASFAWWQRPPIRLMHKVYVFNYTNIGDFEKGKAKRLRVEETGPYVYAESLNRVNVLLHENETASYQERRSYQWIGGRPDKDLVIVPNVPLMSALAYSRNINFASQMLLTALLTAIRSKPFLELSVGELLWGYDDAIFLMAKSFAPFERRLPFDKFGLLASKNGLNEDRITVHTGVGDLGRIGQIQRINGMETRSIWGNEECDRIYGTDGSMFSPHLLDRPNVTLHVYAKDICRTIPFRYVGRRFVHDIPAFRYEIPSDVFNYTSGEGSCFCIRETESGRVCPPAGIFNVSRCNFGSPLLVSFPHFYAADEAVLEQIDGLNPRRERRSFIDLHPRLAVPINGYSRIQLNLEVRKVAGVPLSGNLKDGAILPLIWIESTLEELPESLTVMLHRAHYLFGAVEAGFQWCSLIVVPLSFGAFIRALRRNDSEDLPGPTIFGASSERNGPTSKEDAVTAAANELRLP